MSIKDEARDYMDLPDAEAEVTAMRAFQKLEPIDQFRLMLWLAKRDASICEKRIFIEFCGNEAIKGLAI